MENTKIKSQAPLYRVEDYVLGKGTAYGQFESRSGKVLATFEVAMNGYREGDDRIIVEEDFLYGSGETDRKVWDLRLQDDGSFTGTREGVVGEASARLAGNSLAWLYRMELPLGEKRSVALDFTDTMRPVADGIVLGRAVARKFGLIVGTVTMIIHQDR